jgi:hypothetical protein
MAKEITVNCSLAVSNGLYSESFTSGSPQFDQTTQLAAAGIVEVGTAVETVSLGEVTTAGYAMFRNLSTATAGTAYIALGHYDGTNLHEFVSLRRGQPAMMPLRATVTVGAKAYGQANKLRYIILSE